MRFSLPRMILGVHVHDLDAEERLIACLIWISSASMATSKQHLRTQTLLGEHARPRCSAVSLSRVPLLEATAVTAVPPAALVASRLLTASTEALVKTRVSWLSML